MSDTKLYDTDFRLWSEGQASALRRRAGNEIDWENVAEEIESLGKRDKRELGNRINTVLIHLLKLRLSQASEPRRGWKDTVIEQQERINALLKDSPGLRREVAGLIADQLPVARKRVALQLDEHEELVADIETIAFDEKDVLEG